MYHDGEEKPITTGKGENLLTYPYLGGEKTYHGEGGFLSGPLIIIIIIIMVRAKHLLVPPSN